MLPIRFIKFESMSYVIHYKNGKIKKEGAGLSFFYYAPKSSIAAVPIGSNDLQFIFNDTTADFQTLTIQGQITYKVTDPKKLAELLDFTVNPNGVYIKHDYEKLGQRLINEAQTAVSAYVQSITLKDALRGAKNIETHIDTGLKSSAAVSMLGVEVLSVTVIGVKPTPEMARALETQTREALQQEADQAIYLRRNFAVEQERKIKESELNTEIAVEEKNREIAEKRMDAQIAVEEKKKQIAAKQMEAQVAEEENQRKLREMKMAADIAVEEKRKAFIEVQSDNDRKQADAQGYAIAAIMKAYKDVDWKTLMAISHGGQDPRANIALAFRELAENADKIGTLNITPDLLDQVMKKESGGKGKS